MGRKGATPIRSGGRGEGNAQPIQGARWLQSIGDRMPLVAMVVLLGMIVVAYCTMRPSQPRMLHVVGSFYPAVDGSVEPMFLTPGENPPVAPTHGDATAPASDGAPTTQASTDASAQAIDARGAKPDPLCVVATRTARRTDPTPLGLLLIVNREALEDEAAAAVWRRRMRAEAVRRREACDLDTAAELERLVPLELIP
jgi:hypothetical protein